MRKSNTSRLLSTNYLQICLGNFLLFVSRYMLLPVLPGVISHRLGASLALTGTLFLFLTAGMFIVGPFYSYLVDVYKRKYVYILSFALMLAATVGCILAESISEFLLLCVVHGMAFGIATSSGITLAIDLTNPNRRSVSNIFFGWTSRLGMMIGIAGGVAVFMLKGFETAIYISVGVGGLGIFFLSMLYVPFRAPIGTKICSSDRFLLIRGWIPMINMLLIAFVPGVLIPLIPHFYRNITLMDTGIPFFAIVASAFFCSVVLMRLLVKKENMRLQIGSGLVVISLALLLLILPDENTRIVPAAILLGIGLGLSTPEFLLMMVRLSQHCQRSTANTTHLLGWELGIALGVAAACYFNVYISDSPTLLYRISLLSSLMALAFFLLVAYPYFIKKRIR
ncbi:MFS transporter [uncultured Bacteroides sp.]|uniref:MFS transporter n=1 Tax=uncultured Bacteroides sp. TaxID=162156 RepID=UPI002AAAA2F0|nr:MFS transporter [uncultured Bacteroides sp.]